MLQSALALWLAYIAMHERLFRGHYETQDATVLERVSFFVFEMEFGTVTNALLSLLATAAALTPPGRLRRGGYGAYAAGVVLLIVVELAALLVLQQASFSYRWVFTGGGTVQPQEWKLFVFESVWFFQIPILIVLVNPVLWVLATRSIRPRGSLSA